MKTATRLDWRTVYRTAPGVVACKRADGRWPGWYYELTRSPQFPGGPLVWRAWFHDGSALTRALHERENGVATLLLASPVYAQVASAARAHHENPGL